MRVLLTGNRGYIGTVAAGMLRRADCEVVGLDTGYYADCVIGDAEEHTVERQIKQLHYLLERRMVDDQLRWTNEV